MNAPFEARSWTLANGKALSLGPKGHLMGVINVTPDSFSDGGRFLDPQAASDHAQLLCRQGASIVDIGAESTKPGAATVSAKEEQERLLPALEVLLANCPQTIVSVDTYRAETASLALAAGAHIVNDVWGLQREPDIAIVAAEHNAGIVIMHTNREREALPDVIEDQKAFFGKSLEIAEKSGLSDDQIVLDPGFGFGKETLEMNAELMARFEQLHSLGFPFLIGTSRKRFLGAITDQESGDRDIATAATTALLRQKGAAIFRVHDVPTNLDALKVCDAMLEHGAAP